MAKSKIVTDGDVSEPAALPAVRPVNGDVRPAQGTPLGQCPTNIDLTTPRGKAMAYNAMAPGDIDFGPDEHCEIVATHYLVYPDTAINQESGEVAEVTRTVLIDRQGRTYKTTSESAPQRMQILMQIYSKPEWAVGVQLVIYRRRSPRTGRTYHDIRAVMPPE